MSKNPAEISNVIKQQIKNYKSRIEMMETGTVILEGDGIARVYGLRACMASELLEFEDGTFGLAQNLEDESVSVALLSDDNNIHEGSLVRRTGRVLSVPVGEELLGRVVDALGQPIDGRGPIDTGKSLPVEAEAPGIIERQGVSVPLQTGIKAIDSMIPIGRGQRELYLCGHRTEEHLRGTDSERTEERKCHGEYHHRIRFGFRVRAAAVRGTLCRLRHGGIFPRPGQGRSDYLRRSVQARGGLQGAFPADPPSAWT